MSKRLPMKFSSPGSNPVVPIPDHSIIRELVYLTYIFLNMFIPLKTLLYLNKRLPLGLRHKEVEESIRAESNRS